MSENWEVTPASTPRILALLSSLHTLLHEQQSAGLVLSFKLVSYTVFPLTSILQRNNPSTIPDQIVEKILRCLSILWDSWWWQCDLRAWEQVFMLCAAVVGGIEGKGKGKDRDDETKDAAVCCLESLVRPRREDEDPIYAKGSPSRNNEILARLQAHTQTPQFIPVLGQSLNFLILASGSSHLPLQRHSLSVLHALIAFYAPEDFIPSIVPGVVSTMTRVALGMTTAKGWANGDIVVGALQVLQTVIIRSISDEICLKEGAIHNVSDLDDLVILTTDSTGGTDDNIRPYATPRTHSWLQATSSQLLIAVNTLTPLVSHSNPAAMEALSSFSASVLARTPLTFPRGQPLLLSFLLSVSNSPQESVSQHALQSLHSLLDSSSTTRHTLFQTLLQTTKENLTSLPRLLASHSDAKVEHVASQIEAVCRLPFTRAPKTTNFTGDFLSISKGVGTLLGSMGGIEKWGWRLLSVLEFDSPLVTATGTSEAQLMLEDDLVDVSATTFPLVNLRQVATRSTQHSIERMFRALGKAGGEEGLYSVEWFIAVGRRRRDAIGVSALWCACRLLEGVSGIGLDQENTPSSTTAPRSRRLLKAARGIAKTVGDLWEEADVVDSSDTSQPMDDGSLDLETPVDHVKGLVSQALDPALRIGFGNPPPSIPRPPSATQHLLHRGLCLHLLSVTSGILQVKFTPLLLHTLYPVLQSIISSVSFLSTTGLATLGYISVSTSYASPANLLLSNFDYALDAVSRRLTRQHLDVESAKVLIVLVRLVGRDIVNKAGDVVEECFDRLDEYHGYGVVVEGLLGVLGEVVKAIEDDEASHATRERGSSIVTSAVLDEQWIASFSDWFVHRNDTPHDERDTTDYGPFPREPWGKSTHQPDDFEESKTRQEADPSVQPPSTPTQTLTTQIVSRSIYFLTHASPLIRSRILILLAAAVPVLPESALLPSIHKAWPFILNRLLDPEPYVVSAVASLIEALSTSVGAFMYQRVWDDIWPRFKKLLDTLGAADSQSALARRAPGATGTESAYTHSHRLYKSVIKTMTAAIDYVTVPDSAAWEVSMLFRRFLHAQVHEELQAYARGLYMALAKNNADAVWLVLSSTQGDVTGPVAFLREEKWDVRQNVTQILALV